MFSIACKSHSQLVASIIFILARPDKCYVMSEIQLPTMTVIHENHSGLGRVILQPQYIMFLAACHRNQDNSQPERWCIWIWSSSFMRRTNEHRYVKATTPGYCLPLIVTGPPEPLGGCIMNEPRLLILLILTLPTHSHCSFYLNDYDCPQNHTQQCFHLWLLFPLEGMSVVKHPLQGQGCLHHKWEMVLLGNGNSCIKYCRMASPNQ